jgi:hypothetical protein
MKKIYTTVFLDTIPALIPKRLSFLDEIIGSKKSNSLDTLPIKLLNKINKNNNFNIVLLDKIKHKKEEMDNIITSYGIEAKLHNDWQVNYSDELQSPFTPIAKWLSENKTDNYIVLINSKYQFELDFKDSSDVNFNYIHFIDENNGISLKNLQDIQQTLKLWI